MSIKDSLEKSQSLAGSITSNEAKVEMEKLEKLEKSESKAEEAALDEALRETFPASDPVAISITPEEKPPALVH